VQGPGVAALMPALYHGVDLTKIGIATKTAFNER
jgi:hypothetical protein